MKTNKEQYSAPVCEVTTLELDSVILQTSLELPLPGFGDGGNLFDYTLTNTENEKINYSYGSCFCLTCFLQ